VTRPAAPLPPSQLVASRMRRVRTRATAAEQRVARRLRHLGIAYSTRTDSLPGRPDFVLIGRSVAIFVDGCFWHRCPRCFVIPRHNREWWLRKIDGNRRRDRRKDRALRALGFRVLHLREHDSNARIERRLIMASRRWRARSKAPRSNTGR
jgi:DNA mismatch endonuclease (patch repair protein)